MRQFHVDGAATMHALCYMPPIWSPTSHPPSSQKIKLKHQLTSLIPSEVWMPFYVFLLAPEPVTVFTVPFIIQPKNTMLSLPLIVIAILDDVTLWNNADSKYQINSKINSPIKFHIKSAIKSLIKSQIKSQIKFQMRLQIPFQNSSQIHFKIHC